MTPSNLKRLLCFSMLNSAAVFSSLFVFSLPSLPQEPRFRVKTNSRPKLSGNIKASSEQYVFWFRMSMSFEFN